MTPTPDLHQDEEYDAHGDVRSEENVAAPEKHPAAKIEADLSEYGASKGQQRQPEAHSNGQLEMLGDIDSSDA